MLVIKMFHWPFLVLMVGVTSMAISTAVGAWFHTNEYLFHVIH